MGLVLEFGGAKREAVFAAFRRVATSHSFSIFLLPVSEEDSLKYCEFDGSLEEAFACVSEGQCSSIQIEGCGASPFLAGLYRPGFAGQVLADWCASAEGQGLNAEELFEELRSVDELGYVALFMEDSPDFDAKHITEFTFPWTDWRLVVGAVRAGEWIVRRGAT